MNSFAFVFLATFAIVAVSQAEAYNHQKLLFGPRPWIPLNIPLPKPQTPPGTSPGTQPATCPTAPDGCTECGTTDPLKCSATEGKIGPCFTGACPAACTGCVLCKNCTP